MKGHTSKCAVADETFRGKLDFSFSTQQEACHLDADASAGLVCLQPHSNMVISNWITATEPFEIRLLCSACVRDAADT